MLFFQTTRPEFEGSEFIVRRRYNDFIWLRQKLVDIYSSHIIPVRVFFLSKFIKVL